ncbi:MAG: hypothetical protein HWN66_13745 [Candidatus Helarchaeota archaeon]|nr:hypothetical protein [Candidatus Helarchaeota archaeon]
MPKKEHVHIVTDLKHKEILGKLGDKYGSMTKAFEYAIESLEKFETVGSCDNCEIKFEAEQIDKYQKLLNVVTFTADNIQELVKYLRGELTARELLIRSRKKTYEFGKKYLSFLRPIPENNYENLLGMAEEWKKRTRFFKEIQVDRFTKKIIARVNVLEDLPLFVLTGFMGYLESFGFTFDIELFQHDIILKWLTPEMYSQEKDKIEERILSYIQDTEQLMKPYLMQKGFLLVSSQFLDWLGENLFDHYMLPITVAYHFANVTAGEWKQPQTAKEIATFCADTLRNINFAEEITIDSNNNKNTFMLNILCRTPSLTKFVLQGLIVILGKWGWKLENHQTDSRRLSVNFYYVGEDDPTILDPLYIQNFIAYLNQRFQKLRIVPVDEYNDLTNSLYELDPDKFCEVFNKQGIKVAHAMKHLAKNDLNTMEQIGNQIIPQLLDLKEISLIQENNKVILIFKKTDIVKMEIARSLFVTIMKEYGYHDITSKISENMMTVGFTRPHQIEITSESIE